MLYNGWLLITIPAAMGLVSNYEQDILCDLITSLIVLVTTMTYFTRQL